MNNDRSDWFQAPLYLFIPKTVYMVSAAPIGEPHPFRGTRHLRILQKTFFNSLQELGWEPRAWAFFSDHYHFMAKAPVNGSIQNLVQHFHSAATEQLNRMDNKPGRVLWNQFHERCIWYESSYYARLSYILHNAEHHGLVTRSDLYPFCSAAWLDMCYSEEVQNRINAYKTDQLHIKDQFAPAWRRHAGSLATGETEIY